ncbi:MAG: cytochrome P450 [Myxococcota bacterium]
MTAADPFASWDPAAPEFQANPHPTWSRLRAEQPIYPRLMPDGRRTWIVTRHRDCVTVLRDPDCSAQKFPTHMLHQLAADPAAPFAVIARTVLAMMLVKDDPDHGRLRGLVNKAFTPRVVSELRPRVQAITDELLDAAAKRGELDAIADFGMPLPIIVIAELLGVPLEERANLKRWSDKLVTFLDGTIRDKGLAEAAKACVEMRAYMDRVFAERRAAPRDDLISRLIAAREIEDRLSDDELFGTVVLILAAGHETTTNLIGNGLYTLLRHPAELARLHARPDMIGSAVEELLRFEGPVALTSRNPNREYELDGRTIAKDDELSVVLAAANRDPAVFADPDRLDLSRGENRHLSFGFGAHFCLGAALARLEGQIALGSIVARFPAMKLVGDTVAWKPGIVLRGLVELPIRV